MLLNAVNFLIGIARSKVGLPSNHKIIMSRITFYVTRANASVDEALMFSIAFALCSFRLHIYIVIDSEKATRRKVFV